MALAKKSPLHIFIWIVSSVAHFRYYNKVDQYEVDCIFSIELILELNFETNESLIWSIACNRGTWVAQ